jgi:hypothetical protein
MTVTLDLPFWNHAKLVERANIAGVTPELLAKCLLVEALRRGTNFAEIEARTQQAWNSNPASEDEIDALVNEVRQEIWDESHTSAMQ